MDITSLKDQVSAEEWQLRCDLAAAYRLVALFGWSDLVFTHISARLPGAGHHFLINPYGLLFEEITASSLIRVDQDGNKLQDSPFPVNPAGFTIHSAVHMARHDAACVIHTHTRAGMAVASLKEGLLPLNQIALQFYGRLGTHDYEGVALDLDERERIIADLGDKSALLLRNHGLLTVGRSVAEAFQLMYYLNLACEVQIAAQSTGAELVMPSLAAREKVARQNDRTNLDEGELQLEWAAHLRLLDKIDPSYRD